MSVGSHSGPTGFRPERNTGVPMLAFRRPALGRFDLGRPCPTTFRSAAIIKASAYSARYPGHLSGTHRPPTATGCRNGPGLSSTRVARHAVIVERFQDGLSHRAELPSRQCAGRVAAHRWFGPFQLGYVVRLHRAAHRLSKASQVERRCRITLTRRHADHLSCLRLLGHSASSPGGLRAVH